MDYKTTGLKQNKDQRGWLTEVFREDMIGDFKQVYVATLKGKAIRGSHYHKKRREWFFIIKGKGIMRLEDIRNKGEVLDILMDEKDQNLIEIGPWIHHTLINTLRTTMIKVSATSDMYNKEEPDTYIEFECPVGLAICNGCGQCE